MEGNFQCSSLHTNVTNKVGTTLFKCPSCLNETIVRSPEARKTGTRYTCKSCGFTGPN